MAAIIIHLSDKRLRILGVLLGFIALGCALSYAWSSRIFVSKYILHGYISDASGLSQHSPVRLEGVTIGSVAAIRPAPQPSDPGRGIELALKIDRRYQDVIRNDSSAKLIKDGILGNRYVSISRGLQGRVIDANGEIRFVATREITVAEAADLLKKISDCYHAEKASAPEIHAASNSH
jgi:phospholipid/cholesterol/gamma-HCH transport system substrate-binding protein